MNNPEIDIYGTLRWRNENWQYHREDGPALIMPNGSCVWYKNGEYHREDGPAIEYANGHKQWWVNGVFVRKEKENE